MQTLTENLIETFMKLYQLDHSILAHAVINCGINSVSPVNWLILYNPDMLKYLQDIVRVHTNKWVFQT